ncbi:MAG: ParB/RepB/Spo0J family partition protein [Acidobacteriota bacterium]|nr:ParB/RepB/Spo0J family partition protein [Acidobacteriota bacterium]
MIKKPALGKGLSSLLPARSVETAPEITGRANTVTELPVDAITLNPAQPRREFREQQLSELAQSIRQDGVIQPLVVRQVGSVYQLVAGERRLRAAKLAGLQLVPVAVQVISDDRLLEIALIENIQREDLHPIELAEAFEKMSSGLGLNHEEIGRRTGKDRATVTNAIRLLQLPPDIQQMVANRQLSPGHARALLKVNPEQRQREMAQQAVTEGWTVRKIEQATQSVAATGKEKLEQASQPADPNLTAATDNLERALGTRVRIIDRSRGKGKIEIEYYDLDDLNRIYFYITRQD